MTPCTTRCFIRAFEQWPLGQSEAWGRGVGRQLPGLEGGETILQFWWEVFFFVLFCFNLGNKEKKSKEKTQPQNMLCDPGGPLQVKVWK